RRGLTRPVRAEHRHRLPRRDTDTDIQLEPLAPRNPELGRQRHRAAPSHFSRNPASTSTETTNSTRLSTIATFGSVSNARYVANGSVRVSPGKFPAKVIVAPNSPNARAQHNTAPAAIPGATLGNVTRRNVSQRPAPNVAAASS